MQKPLFQKAGRAARRGFTLAELMVVIVILGLLATVVAPNVIGYLTQGKVTKVKADLKAIDGAVETFAMRNNGKFPNSLEQLIEEDEYGHAYLKQTSVPKDPWGNEYLYDPPVSSSGKYRVYSYGADGIPGGEGEDQDYDMQWLNSQ